MQREDEWSRRARDEENAEKRRGGAIEREGAVPGAIVLSVSCWRGRTKKTGGLWRITCLSHSLGLFALLFTHILSAFTLGGMGDSSAFVCILSPNPSIFVILDYLPQSYPLLPPLFTPSKCELHPQRQVGLEQVEGRPIGAGRKE